MSAVRSAAQEAAEDLFFGQSVIIWARWFVIIAGVVVVLWSTSDIGTMSLAVLMIAPLIVINFFVYGRYLMEKPVNQYLLLALSLVDLVVVSLFVLFMKPETGYASPYYIFFYPLLLAVAFVFPIRISIPYTIVGLLLYVGSVLIIGPEGGWTGNELETMLVRLITMATMGVLGAFYWRIQRERRRTTVRPAGFSDPELS
jgi:phosphoglycerol transferase MdoB-like AlkP superfamily enzyme